MNPLINVDFLNEIHPASSQAIPKRAKFDLFPPILIDNTPPTEGNSSSFIEVNVSLEQESNPRLFTLIVLQQEAAQKTFEPVHRRYSDFLLFFNLLQYLNEQNKQNGKKMLLLPPLPKKHVKFYVNMLLDNELVVERKNALDLFAKLILNSSFLKNRFDVYCFFNLKNEGFIHYSKLVKGYLTTAASTTLPNMERRNSFQINDLFPSFHFKNKAVVVDGYLLDVSVLEKTKQMLITYKKAIEKKIKNYHDLIESLSFSNSPEETMQLKVLSEFLKLQVVKLNETNNNISNTLLSLLQVETYRILQLKQSLDENATNKYDFELEGKEKTKMFCFCIKKFVENQIISCKDFNSVAISNLIQVMMTSS